MPTSSPTHHPQSQWTPQCIELRLRLSPKSMNPNSRFYALINQAEGFEIPTPCVFTTTSRDRDSLRILLNSNNKRVTRPNNSSEKGRELSFHTNSSLEEASISCSKLNMSIALLCKIVAKFRDGKVVFTITAPDKTAEKRLFRQFNVFEGTEYDD